MTINSIKSLIQDVLWEIPDNYRCYEITRRLKTEFSKRSMNFEVRDGFADYYLQTFFNEAMRKNCNLLLPANKIRECVEAARLSTKIGKREASLPDNMRWRISIYHSWGMLPSEKLLIDCHRKIVLKGDKFCRALEKFPVLREIEVRNYLSVIPMKKLPTKPIYLYGDAIFWELAKQIGNEVHYSEHNYVTKLRCTA